MIKDIQTASFFLKDGLNDNSEFRWCFCPGDAGGGGAETGGGSEAEGSGTDDETDLSSADPSRGPGPEGPVGGGRGFGPQGPTDAVGRAAAAAAAGRSGMTEPGAGFGDIADKAGLVGVTFGPMVDNPDYHSGFYDPMAPPDEYPTKKYREPRQILPKMYTSPLLQDVTRMLPKMDRLVDRETAEELGQNYLEMLTQAGVEAKAEGREGLVEDIQEELDRGLLADYYQNYDLMNTLENVGYKTFGTGYRGQYEARTGKSITRDQYDPNTITGAGTGERSATISLFNQFALANPNMTAMEAMAAFNATQNPDAQVSAVDLGMLGYDPNAPAGPQAQANEDERYRGFVQGLGLIGKGVAFGPASVAADIALSGKTGEESVLGILGKELNDQTGIPDMIESAYDQFTTDLGKARDTVVDAVQENIVDPVSEFFSRGLDTPEQASISNFGRAEEAFFDPVDIGNPYAGLSTPEFEAQIAFEESQRGLQAEKEAAPGSDAANQLAEALENAAYYDSLMNPAAVSPPEPGSFFEGLDPKETQDYIDRVTTPEGVKLVRKTRAQAAPRPPTVSEQVSAPRTGSFFPGSFDRRTATPRTRTQTIADIYGLSEEDANRMLGIA